MCLKIIYQEMSFHQCDWLSACKWLLIREYASSLNENYGGNILMERQFLYLLMKYEIN